MASHGDWRVVGRNDLMSPPTITWYVNNWHLRKSYGPFATKAAAEAKRDALSKEATG